MPRLEVFLSGAPHPSTAVSLHAVASRSSLAGLHWFTRLGWIHLNKACTLVGSSCISRLRDAARYPAWPFSCPQPLYYQSPAQHGMVICTVPQDLIHTNISKRVIIPYFFKNLPLLSIHLFSLLSWNWSFKNESMLCPRWPRCWKLREKCSLPSSQ